MNKITISGKLTENRMWVPGCLMPVIGESGRRLTLRDVTARCAGRVLCIEAGTVVK